MCCQNWPGLTWTPRPYQHTVLTLSLCPAWIARDKLNIKPMVGTCRKRSISAPELETSIHERWEQKLAKDIRKQQKIFYHSHVYIKNVGSCNFLCLFPCSLTYFMFPCSLRFFALFPCSHCQISLVPLFPKNPWGTLNYLIRSFFPCYERKETIKPAKLLSLYQSIFEYCAL